MHPSPRRTGAHRADWSGRGDAFLPKEQEGHAFIAARRLHDGQFGAVPTAKGGKLRYSRRIVGEALKGRNPNQIYLSAAAQAVLATLPRIEGNPHSIAGAKDGAPRADLKKPWAAVRKGAGIEGVRLHDLRHSFASIGAGASMGLPVIGKLLGHSQAATTHRYAHLDADPLRRAVDTIGATISAAMSGETARNVVAMSKGKLR